MNKGFTLIELLVVVLIIGILAAVALPQYTKAVERSRMTEAVQRLGDLATAQSIWYMQHGTFASSTDIADGDITFGDTNESFTFPAFSATTAGSDSITMTAQRSGGMYGQEGEGNRGILSLTVAPSGAICKSCAGPTEFCGMAATAGYNQTCN